MLKNIFWAIEDLKWNLLCQYNLWLHGPYGLAKVVERMPFRFAIQYLRKYGASIGEDCIFERGINIHRPIGTMPFENLYIGNNVYLGHSILIDLSRKVSIEDYVCIGARSQIWTHTGYYSKFNMQTPEYKEQYGEIVIHTGAIIYTNVVVTHSTCIGKFARVGANSLVIQDVEYYTLVSGIPAKKIEDINH